MRGKMHDGPFQRDAEVRLQRGDLRNVRRAACKNGHEWLAPVINRCPTCGTIIVHVLEEKQILVPRV